MSPTPKLASRTARGARHHLFGVLLLAAAIGLGLARTARADSFTPAQRAEIVQIVREALKKDPSILRDAVAAWRTDEANRQQAEARQAIKANHSRLYDAADPSSGPANAAVTIIEFFDPRCPYCRQVDPMLSLWQQHDPDIRVVYKDLPILGPPSVIGSRALLAAQRQGAYLKFRAALMSSPPDIDEAMIKHISDQLGLDWSKLQADMKDPAISQRLADNEQLAHQLGIQGTPAFVVGDRLVIGSTLTDVQAAAQAAAAAARKTATQ